jgi:NAD(P)-dependent dehydrogenase (short-subunit alcohol dehydrogenase family)
VAEEHGREVVTGVADVRWPGAVDVVAEGLDAFGRIDVVCANAGLMTSGKTWMVSEEEWDAIISVIDIPVNKFHFEESAESR